MREWRKVYRSITSSERLATVSDPAWRLYVLLLVNQDDTGVVPWTRAMVRTLIAGTAWTEKQADHFLGELRAAGLVKNYDKSVTIRRGVELNGPPHNGSSSYKKPRTYADSTDSVRTAYVPRTSSVLPQRREEERREETPLIPLAGEYPLQGDSSPLKGETIPIVENQSIPEWLEELRQLPKWSVGKEEKLRRWTEHKGFEDAHLLRTALALKAKWNGKKWVDPVATFKNWAMGQERKNGYAKRLDARPEDAAGRDDALAKYG